MRGSNERLHLAPDESLLTRQLFLRQIIHNQGTQLKVVYSHLGASWVPLASGVGRRMPAPLHVASETDG
ncbi:uncharacterized protein SETTUDRAFT_165828 [Exserohilum turcica Et28A]|uniref:Uncharacterized protein n=1 Tax=Exserohilum turcicum (strain 28A) TaxID=671987 RepID=R0JYL1_EXST2|nr:uncharacterized protein SETTUDRAFT_165828 [Exserohilum turcica Et28A]EOA81332.1 hypothetical protein SETTUDRAFT_165828 [Exserohilum turcica Et28A]